MVDSLNQNSLDRLLKTLSDPVDKWTANWPEWASLKLTGYKVTGGRQIGCYLNKNTRSLNCLESDNHLRSIIDLGFH